jgi:capsular polysaccharide biosynthesis protein
MTNSEAKTWIMRAFVVAYILGLITGAGIAFLFFERGGG